MRPCAGWQCDDCHGCDYTPYTATDDAGNGIRTPRVRRAEEEGGTSHGEYLREASRYAGRAAQD